MNDEEEYAEKIAESEEENPLFRKIISAPNSEEALEIVKKIPKKKIKNLPEVTEKIIQLLEKLEGNIRGKGNGSKQIKEIRELARQTTIGKVLNKGLEYIEMAVGRKYYTEIYDRIGSMKGRVKAL